MARISSRRCWPMARRATRCGWSPTSSAARPRRATLPARSGPSRGPGPRVGARAGVPFRRRALGQLGRFRPGDLRGQRLAEGAAGGADHDGGLSDPGPPSGQFGARLRQDRDGHGIAQPDWRPALVEVVRELEGTCSMTRRASSRRRLRHPALSDHPFAVEAAAAALTSRWSIIPVGADAGGPARDRHHHHARGPGSSSGCSRTGRNGTWR